MKRNAFVKSYDFEMSKSVFHRMIILKELRDFICKLFFQLPILNLHQIYDAN